MRRKNNGYSLIELMIAISLFSALSIITFHGLKTMQDNYLVEENEASIDLRKILKQELILEGISKEIIESNSFIPLTPYGDIDASIFQSDSTLNMDGKNQVSLLSAVFHEPRERINVVGKIINNEIKPVFYLASKLFMPKANYFHSINLDMFPIKNFISPNSENPVGTYYRYSIDGTNPNNSSLLWDFSDLNLNHWSPSMKFKAYNTNPRYLESDVLAIDLNLQGSVSLRREDGSNNLSVSYREIITNNNKIVIIPPLSDPSIEILYRINSNATIKYEKPFHVPIDNWGTKGVTLTVKIRVPQYVDPISIQEFNLNIKKELLPMPQVMPDGGTLLINSFIKIMVDKRIASLHTTVDGQDEKIYLNIEEVDAFMF